MDSYRQCSFQAVFGMVYVLIAVTKCVLTAGPFGVGKRHVPTTWQTMSGGTAMTTAVSAFLNDRRATSLLISVQRPWEEE